MSNETAKLVDQWILRFLEAPALSDPDLLRQIIAEHDAMQRDALSGPDGGKPMDRPQKPSREVATPVDTPEDRPDNGETGAGEALRPRLRRQA